MARLRDGTVLTIRAPREDDVAKIASAFAHLAEDTIYTRFFHNKRELTDEEMGRVTHPDMDAHVFLFATTGEGEAERIVGAADYAAYDDADGARAAEIAFLIEEAYQGRGLASLLLGRLIAFARSHGVARLVADVLTRNDAMLSVFAHSGLPNEKHVEGGVIHVTMDLGTAATAPG